MYKLAQVGLTMPERRFQRFVLAWSAVSMLNEGLNGYAADLSSLTPRTASLGLLLMTASVMHCLRAPVDAKMPGGRSSAGDQIRAALYVALLASTGLPSLAWRCFRPEDAVALGGLRHGASIAFALGVLTLAAVRMLTHLRLQGRLTLDGPR